MANKAVREAEKVWKAAVSDTATSHTELVQAQLKHEQAMAASYRALVALTAAENAEG